MKRIKLNFIILAIGITLLSACGGGGGGDNTNTPVDSTPCTDTSWTPDTNTVQNGVQFTQISNCDNTRSNVGTKAAIINEASSTLSFDATQSLNLNLLKTQVAPTFSTFSIKSMPSFGALAISPIGQSTLTYLSQNYNVTDTFSIDTTGSGNADVFVSVLIKNGDPLFIYQWYVINQRSDIMGDINARKTLAKGYSGKGVHVGVVDDFANASHEDLNIIESYNPDSRSIDSHGTAVAGIIGASAYNGLGVRGIAYGASLHNYDRNTAGAEHWQKITGSSTLNPNSAQVDIFNFSFGAVEQGATAEYGKILGYGVANHRGGKGAIYVAGAGNSGDNDAVQLHNVNWGVYPINVSGLNPLTNTKIDYSSIGSGLWLTAYSRPTAGTDNTVNNSTNGLATTGLGNSEYIGFSGTSGSAPIISGAIALILEANASLTWRDVRYILAKTARQVDADIAPATRLIGGVEYTTRLPWTTNAAGYDFHEWYGFGLIDVDSAVEMAENYATNTYSVLYNANYIDLVTSDTWHSSETLSPALNINPQDGNGVSRTITIAQNISIESLEVFIDTINDDAGDFSIKLTSPAGTIAIIAPINNNSNNHQMSANNFFGENSLGDWTIELVNVITRAEALSGWRLRFFGVMN